MVPNIIFSELAVYIKTGKKIQCKIDKALEIICGDKYRWWFYEKVQKEILSNPYSKQYSDILDVYRKSFFKGKFSLYYKIDEAKQIIWITDFRSNKQRPLF